MVSAQDKILHVANKLGLTSLKDMQASTGAVYDADIDGNGVIFGNASQHAFPGVTNLTQNRFEVNEALLIETIAFYTTNPTGANPNNALSATYGADCNIVFDVIVGNKRVLKDVPIIGAGHLTTFGSAGIKFNTDAVTGAVIGVSLVPRNQVFMEGVGILIPPQVDFSIEYRIFNVATGAVIPIDEDNKIAAYIYGTKVLLNFNTSL